MRAIAIVGCLTAIACISERGLLASLTAGVFLAVVHGWRPLRARLSADSQFPAALNANVELEETA